MGGRPAQRRLDIGYSTLHEAKCAQGQDQLASNTLVDILAIIVLVLVHPAVSGQSQRYKTIPEGGCIGQEGAKGASDGPGPQACVASGVECGG